jgi:hypothetical protein
MLDGVASKHKPTRKAIKKMVLHAGVHHAQKSLYGSIHTATFVIINQHQP